MTSENTLTGTPIASSKNLEKVLRRPRPSRHPDGPARVALARVSTLDQDHAIQLADLTTKGGVPDELIFTEKISGASDDRPEFDACMRFLRGGDTLVAWKLDRLSRKGIGHVLNIVDELIERGVTVQFIKEGITVDPGSDNKVARMVLSILASVAEYERSIIRERTFAGILLRLQAGEWSGARRPYGYRTTGERRAGNQKSTLGLEIDPHEAGIIEWAAGQLLAGGSLRGNARALNEKGETTTRGNQWHNRVLSRILISPTTAGKVTLELDGKTEYLPGTWEPILDEDRWNAIRALLLNPARRQPNNKGPERVWVGTGVYLCGKCTDAGKTVPMKATLGGGARKTPETKTVYRCSGPVNHLAVSARLIDDFVEEKLHAFFTDPDSVRVFAEERHKEQEAGEDLGLVLAGYEAELDAVEAARDAEEITTMQYLGELKRINPKLEEVRERISATASKSALDGLMGADDIAGSWDALTPGQRASVIRATGTVTIRSLGPGRRLTAECVTFDPHDDEGCEDAA